MGSSFIDVKLYTQRFTFTHFARSLTPSRQKKCITHTTQQPILPMPMVDSSTTCGTMLFLLKIRIPKINNNSNNVTNSKMVNNNNKETNTTTTTIRPTMVKKK